MTMDQYVLIVDDEKDFRDSVSFWLKSKGYDVKTAEGGEQALLMIKQAPPCLVFLDIQMPDMDGIDVLKRIRKIKKAIPVIMVTAAYNSERIAKARQLGISGFYPKGGSLEDLVKILEVTIRRHKLEKKKLF